MPCGGPMVPTPARPLPTSHSFNSYLGASRTHACATAQGVGGTRPVQLGRKEHAQGWYARSRLTALLNTEHAVFQAASESHDSPLEVHMRPTMLIWLARALTLVPIVAVRGVAPRPALEAKQRANSTPAPV